MEIRRVLTVEGTGLVSPRPARNGEKEKPAARPCADRVELSRQWARDMEEHRAQVQSALLSGGKRKDEDSGGLLAYMETEKDKLDAMSEALEVQMKCMKIAANMMKGKRVPPEDERYLMEHDPEGYKLAVSMRSLVKQDDEECESVLDDEDKEGAAPETGESAPVEPPSGGGEAEASEE